MLVLVLLQVQCIGGKTKKKSQPGDQLVINPKMVTATCVTRMYSSSMQNVIDSLPQNLSGYMDLGVVPSEDQDYELTSIVWHKSNNTWNRGHVGSNVEQPSGRWTRFDDTDVRTEDDLGGITDPNETPYVVIYQKKHRLLPIDTSLPQLLKQMVDQKNEIFRKECASFEEFTKPLLNQWALVSTIVWTFAFIPAPSPARRLWVS
jgi:hypothetical protein